jgi:hypothetical protein
VVGLPNLVYQIANHWPEATMARAIARNKGSDDRTFFVPFQLILLGPPLAPILADQFAHRSLGFVNPLYYRLLGTPALDDITAPTSALARVRTDYVNGIDASDGLSYRLQTIDMQSTTIHSAPGYDDETGVGSPNGPLFFLGLPAVSGRH